MQVSSEASTHSEIMPESPSFLTVAFRFFILLLSWLLLSTHPGQAASGSWNTTDTGVQAWNNIANWTNSPTPPPGSTSTLNSADVATFNIDTTGTQITIDANRNIHSILFGTSAGSFTLGSAGANLGEALHFSNGGKLEMQGYATIPVSGGTLKNQTLNAPIILEAATSTSAGTFSFINNANNQRSATTQISDAAAAAKMIINGHISGGTTTSSITLTLGGNVGTRSAGTNPNNYANFINGLISDGGAAGGLALTINGQTPATNTYNAWALTNNNNSYTGATTITNGALYFTSLTNSGANSAIGAGSVVNFSSGAHVIYSGGATSTDRTFNFNGGSFYSSGTGAVTLTGSVITNAGTTAILRGSNDLIIDTVIEGGGGLGKTEAGFVYLNRLNTFTGNISISDGTFSTATINDGGANAEGTGIGRGTIITLGQSSSTIGRLQFTGASGGSSSRSIRLENLNSTNGGNGRIENTVAGQTLTLSGNVKTTSEVVTISSSLDLTGAGNGVMSGVIGGTIGGNTNVATNTRLTKNGTGTWSLNGANIYYGGTTVTLGTLLANNANPTSSSATGSGNVTVASGATLGGTGSISGGSAASINLGPGSFLMIGNTHNLAAGATSTASGYTSAVADLHLGSATDVNITLAGTLQFDLFANDVANITADEADQLKIASTFGSITLGGTIAVADVSGAATGSWTAGTWRLIDWSGYSGTKTGSFTFNLPTAPLADGYTWNTNNFLNDGTISIVAVPEPGRVFLLGLAAGTFLLRRRRK